MRFSNDITMARPKQCAAYARQSARPRKAGTLKQPGPRGLAGRPTIGHVSPAEIDGIECLPAEAATVEQLRAVPAFQRRDGGTGSGSREVQRHGCRGHALPLRHDGGPELLQSHPAHLSE